MVGVRWQFGVDVGYLVGLELKETRFLPVVGVRALGDRISLGPRA